MLKPIYIFGLILTLGTVALFLHQKTSLHFSNTQTWDTSLLTTLAEGDMRTKSLDDNIHLSQPPTNISFGSMKDLFFLHVYQFGRTPEIENEIREEQQIRQAKFGDTSLEEIFSDKVETEILITTMVANLDVIILSNKYEYDRVRPHFLDPLLSTVIETPHHPAYPSGHATQSYFIALVLGELNPNQKETYEASAKRIGKNREYAGVHYPSDTLAGQELARQYYQIIKETPWYQNQKEKAKLEW